MPLIGRSRHEPLGEFVLERRQKILLRSQIAVVQPAGKARHQLALDAEIHPIGIALRIVSPGIEDADVLDVVGDEPIEILVVRLRAEIKPARWNEVFRADNVLDRSLCADIAVEGPQDGLADQGLSPQLAVVRRLVMVAPGSGQVEAWIGVPARRNPGRERPLAVEIEVVRSEPSRDDDIPEPRGILQIKSGLRRRHRCGIGEAVHNDPHEIPLWILTGNAGLLADPVSERRPTYVPSRLHRMVRRRQRAAAAAGPRIYRDAIVGELGLRSAAGRKMTRARVWITTLRINLVNDGRSTDVELLAFIGREVSRVMLDGQPGRELVR